MSELNARLGYLCLWSDATLEVTIGELALDLVEKICVVVLFAYIVTRTGFSLKY